MIMLTVFLFENIIAQDIQDFAWKKQIEEREPLAYQKVREADVFWSKRLWQIIDTREKQNLMFTYPQQALIEILHTAAIAGEIRAFDNTVANGDQFKVLLAKEDIKKIGSSVDTIWTMNPYTFEQVPTVVSNKFDFSKVSKFKLKEDWFFNSATSSLEVRIIGIAPLMAVFDDNGNYLGDETLYWLYYPDLRSILAKHEAYNVGNNALRLSWDDVFEARLFSSFIYKEDNVYDRPIQQYATGIDALLESERIKEKIFNFEHDLWTY